MRGGADAGRAAVASRYRAAGRELKVSLVEIPERLRTQDQLLGYLLVHLCLLWTGRCYGSALHDVLLLCVKSRERRSGARHPVPAVSQPAHTIALQPGGPFILTGEAFAAGRGAFVLVG